jgi:hypothetical protein
MQIHVFYNVVRITSVSALKAVQVTEVHVYIRAIKAVRLECYSFINV